MDNKEFTVDFSLRTVVAVDDAVGDDDEEAEDSETERQKGRNPRINNNRTRSNEMLEEGEIF